ncbi:MAG: endonuclease [Paludibacter sp.]|nr:endonuclease [Paludibacter sp.]
MKRISLFFSLLITFSTFAVIPTGYYITLVGKQTAAIKTELHNIICKDTTHYLGYGSGTGNTWQGFYSTDRNTTNNLVIDMYSDSLRYFPSNYVTLGYPGFGMAIQIEHSVPKSWWGCDINHPDCPAKDLNNLYPSDGTTNNHKSNHPLGVVSSISYTNSVSKIGTGTNFGYSGTFFEPADQYKGDFARTYFYMATAYEHYTRKWDATITESMMEADTYPTLKPWAIQLLLQWNRQDPVSQKELTRVENVYAIQKNRNPFIDHPELIEYIWGNLKDTPYQISTDLQQIIEKPFNIKFNKSEDCFIVESKVNDSIAYTIFSTNGIKVCQGVNSTNTQIIIPKLNTGVYIFEITSQNKTFKQVLKIIHN